MLQRTPENIRDKWRTLFKENDKEKVEKKCDLFSLIFQIIQTLEKLYQVKLINTNSLQDLRVKFEAFKKQ